MSEKEPKPDVESQGKRKAIFFSPDSLTRFCTTYQPTPTYVVYFQSFSFAKRIAYQSSIELNVRCEISKSYDATCLNSGACRGV